MTSQERRGMGALERLEAADKLFPGLWDVERVGFQLKDLLEFQAEITPVRQRP